MSTFVESNTFLRKSQFSEEQAYGVLAYNPIGARIGEGIESGIRFSPAFKKQVAKENKVKPRVLRRMIGYLMSFQGKTARVTFVENGQTFEYEMPAEQLTKSGIKLANQPFQMDEVEMQMDEGFLMGYQFKPLAKESDAYVDPLNLDAERKAKLERILKKFAKTEA